MPILPPLRDVVVFPHMMMPFVIGRPSSTRALEHALKKGRKNPKKHLPSRRSTTRPPMTPSPDDIYTMGCVANIVQSLKLPDGNIKVLVEGVERARAVEWKEDKGFYRVVVKVLPRQKEMPADVEETMARVVSLFEQYVKLSNNLHYDAMIAAVRVDDPGAPGRHDCRAPPGGRRRKAEPAGNRVAGGTAEPHRRHPRNRSRQAAGGPPHPVAREEADGEGAEVTVLPQREDEGDPEGTGPQGRQGRSSETDEIKKKIEEAENAEGCAKARPTRSWIGSR